MRRPQRGLPTLRSFVLPGGTRERRCCTRPGQSFRRAERSTGQPSPRMATPCTPPARYLNRLSDCCSSWPPANEPGGDLLWSQAGSAEPCSGDDLRRRREVSGDCCASRRRGFEPGQNPVRAASLMASSTGPSHSAVRHSTTTSLAQARRLPGISGPPGLDAERLRAKTSAGSQQHAEGVIPAQLGGLVGSEAKPPASARDCGAARTRRSRRPLEAGSAGSRCPPRQPRRARAGRRGSRPRRVPALLATQPSEPALVSPVAGGPELRSEVSDGRAVFRAGVGGFQRGIKSCLRLSTVDVAAELGSRARIDTAVVRDGQEAPADRGDQFTAARLVILGQDPHDAASARMPSTGA